MKNRASSRILVSRLVPLAVAALLLTSGSAQADLPPPDGTRFVGYEFVVTGTTASKDDAFFAYPCGSSSGAPILDYRVVEEGKPIGVGRRGGTCEIYRIGKDKLAAFASKRTAPPGGGRDPELEAFAGGARKCAGSPSLKFTLPASDTRSEIRETYVLSLKDAECTLSPSSKGAAPEPKGAVSPPAASSKGCSAASGETGAGASGAWLAGLGVVLGLAAFARRRRDDSPGK